MGGCFGHLRLGSQQGGTRQLAEQRPAQQLHVGHLLAAAPADRQMGSDHDRERGRQRAGGVAQ
jgi:hypothetical protein